MTSPRIVPLSQLLRQYQPATPADFARLIDEHGKMTLAQIARFCYDNQASYIDEYFDLATIQRYVYDLFVTKSFAGIAMEKKAQQYLQAQLPDLVFRAHPDLDTRYAVDFLVGIAGTGTLAGIQVKPDSYKTITSDYVETNQRKNDAFRQRTGAPVLYLYYNSVQRRFTNMLQVLECLQRRLDPTAAPPPDEVDPSRQHLPSLYPRPQTPPLLPL